MEIAPGRGRKRGGGASKACESDSEQIHKDDCSQGDFCLIKKGIVFGTIAHVSCQFVSPYFKFIAYKLALEIIKKRPRLPCAPPKVEFPKPGPGPGSRGRETGSGFFFFLLLLLCILKINSRRYKSFRTCISQHLLMTPVLYW